MTIEVEISVTEDDILNGDPCHAEHCPVALAASRAFASSCAVWAELMELIDGTKVEMPPAASQFVTDFDAGNPVRPFTFTVKVTG